MNESEKQFSFTRAAPDKTAREKQILISNHEGSNVMKMKLSVVAVLLMLTLAPTPVWAQQEKKLLTNANVVELVKAGLDESTVLLAIQQGQANFDTSPTALIDLKTQGVSEKVVQAMLKAPKPGQSSAPASDAGPATLNPAEAQRAAAAMSSMNSMCLIDGAQRVEMKQNKGNLESIIVPFYGKQMWVFEGKQAQFRLTNSSPVFEVTFMANVIPSDHVTLTKPEVKKDKRQIHVMAMAGPFGSKIKPDKKLLVPLVFEELKKEGLPAAQVALHHVKPEKPLPPGEYVLTVRHVFYCFGVDKAK